MYRTFKTVLILPLIILVSSSFYTCKDWEYDVVKNGIHFEKIHQSKGGTHTGIMTENHIIQGFPCAKGWIHFKKDWRLLSFQLSEEYLHKGTLLPAKTWFHFPYHEGRSGYVCSFPYDFEVGGYLCGGSGGYKGIHTGFYESGKLRSFFPSEDLVVNGVPCASSLFVNVQLHENGRIKSCKLAEDCDKDGVSYEKGMSIAFDSSGVVR